jgi:hypothetical protein
MDSASTKKVFNTANAKVQKNTPQQENTNSNSRYTHKCGKCNITQPKNSICYICRKKVDTPL